MNRATQAAVRERAGQRCEYCGLDQADSPLASLHIEHIIPRIHGGTDTLDNLALACIDCNLRKGPNLTGIDPETNQITKLFHRRQDGWNVHFAKEGVHIKGKTAIGRTTVTVLRMNSDEQLALRSVE
jgi:5-methylcytosine-specific restriction endonuclease McrA